MINSRIRLPFYIFFLNPVYNAARSLRSLRSNKSQHYLVQTPWRSLPYVQTKPVGENIEVNKICSCCVLPTSLRLKEKLLSAAMLSSFCTVTSEITWLWSVAWYFAILYLASRIFYLAFFVFAFLSRISHLFILHLAFLSRISHFLSHMSHFLSRISHFYLAFTFRIVFLFLLSRISNVPSRLPYPISCFRNPVRTWRCEIF